MTVLHLLWKRFQDNTGTSSGYYPVKTDSNTIWAKCECKTKSFQIKSN